MTVDQTAAPDSTHGRRTYGDTCAIARALDVIGERWALLVVRELTFGPKRFSDLQAGVPHASPNVLSQRLRELEHSQVVRRRKLGPPARAWVYELTDRGRELEPVLVRLGQWGRQFPLPGDAQLSADSLMLALRTHFDPAKAQVWRATYLIDLDGDPFTIRVDDNGLQISRGEPAGPDVALHTDLPTFRALIIKREPPGRAGRLEITGDRAALDRLLSALQ
ncbi:MAG: winged helix-turn-helix transcriptional regulator [Micromonosporaceae bacterium]